MTSLRYDRAHTRPPHHSKPASRESHSRARWGIPGFLSIIVPAFNESENLPGLVEEIVRTFRPMVGADEGNPLEGFEVVVVDDGSSDDSSTVLDRLSMQYRELRSISLIRNAGQSAAILAGFREAEGAWIGMLDADLQNPPSDLARLWDLLPGHDAALGWRMKREDVLWKRWISRWANSVRNVVLGQSIRDTGCSVRIFPREIALRLPAFRGFHRFLGPLLLREGCRVVQAPVAHRRRAHGVSHYGFWNRSYQVVFDLLGVAWLMRRGVRYQTAASSNPLEPASRAPAPHLARTGSAVGAFDHQEAA
ncbi:MAG: glycosyltransferase [Isosphaeraceae bacterium]|nr:glycosyltransferase [Isosphaeraceae bacterium]